MHIGVIADGMYLTHERVLLDRVVLGLAKREMTITVIHNPAVEGSLPLESAFGDDVRCVEAMWRGPLWMRSDRIERAISALDGEIPDVFFALGGRSAALGDALTAACERPLVVRVDSSRQARHTLHGRHAARVGAYVAANDTLAGILRRHVDPALVNVVHASALIPPTPVDVLRSVETSISIAIVGPGRDVPAYRALLAALSRLLQANPQTQVCLELRGAHQHEIWRLAQRMDLLSNVSTVTDASTHRSLITECDVLAFPERVNRVHSLLLDAMAAGMAVIARHDPIQEVLRDDDTAVVMSQPDPEQWTAGLRGILTQPDRARRLGSAAREFICSEYQPDSHIDGLLATFRDIVEGGVLPFAP